MLVWHIQDISRVITSSIPLPDHRLQVATYTVVTAQVIIISESSRDGRMRSTRSKILSSKFDGGEGQPKPGKIHRKNSRSRCQRPTKTKIRKGVEVQASRYEL
ncbi:uncharacterized protein MYCGRDRAFT_94662 [Zymoseptoria tritici IPO323]|uniref:Uncharacterized protein n=1 Tax=Zymoseptoria tritici (strain CBS 115943 / IPO323) TaxID=336722 RepID=F9XGP0_ZYMTI|nr:uncharacterized protein MYCGRDRAFT_94662 [Zymoseptoria tritici IPO323]EGP86001.1 hypothetical protein MYCGRDRAFT_94662 [Zymoseptoria tritici IPO323]